MIVEAHTLTWNEKDKLRIWCNHYRKFADRLFVWDFGCGDGSIRMVRRTFPHVTIRDFTHPGGLLMENGLKWKNECWKGTDADWVILTDSDEWLYHHSPRAYLEQILTQTDIGILRTIGFNLISLFPPHTLEKAIWMVKEGTRLPAIIEYIKEAGRVRETLEDGLKVWGASFHRGYSKPCIFRPDALKDCQWANSGGHTLRRGKGPAPICASEFLLFNGRRLGTIEAIQQRSVAIVTNRSSQENKAYPRKVVEPNGLGTWINSVNMWRFVYSQGIPAPVAVFAHKLYNHGLSVEAIIEFLQMLKLRPKSFVWDLEHVQFSLGIPIPYWALPEREVPSEPLEPRIPFKQPEK